MAQCIVFLLHFSRDSCKLQSHQNNTQSLAYPMYKPFCKLKFWTQHVTNIEQSTCGIQIQITLFILLWIWYTRVSPQTFICGWILFYLNPGIHCLLSTKRLPFYSVLQYSPAFRVGDKSIFYCVLFQVINYDISQMETEQNESAKLVCIQTTLAWE